MMSVLNDFKIKSDSDPREEMPCGDSTEDVVLKATLMAARRQFTYQVQAMEQASAVIKACFGMSSLNTKQLCPVHYNCTMYNVCFYMSEEGSMNYTLNVNDKIQKMTELSIMFASSE